MEFTPHLVSLAKDVKLDKYTVPTGDWTPGRRMAVHYVIAALRKLHSNDKEQSETHYVAFKTR